MTMRQCVYVDRPLTDTCHTHDTPLGLDGMTLPSDDKLPSSGPIQWARGDVRRPDARFILIGRALFLMMLNPFERVTVSLQHASMLYRYSFCPSRPVFACSPFFDA